MVLVLEQRAEDERKCDICLIYAYSTREEEAKQIRRCGEGGYTLWDLN
jgi:hypothetical protein